ncbi:spore coat U domain-containing protein [Amylibacter sp.]|nr:spore coat U domain-containing protein [Amylibacter sp.]
MKMKLNRSTIKSSIAAATALGIVAVSMPAYAGTGTSNMTVSSNVDVSCNITTTNIDFDAYDAVGVNNTADLTAEGGINTTCTAGSGGNIKIGQGLNKSDDSSDAYPMRRMVHATDNTEFLFYDVYSDSDRLVLWENDTGVAYIGDGSEQTLVVYGVVPKAQNLAIVGSYTDTLVVTINY